MDHFKVDPCFYQARMIFFKFLCSSKCFTSILALLAPAVSGSCCEEQCEAMQSGFSIFQDFKAVLMYFSEAFLLGAKFGNEKLEGETSLVMPEKLVQILEQKEVSEDPRLKPLMAFKKQLQAGLVIAQRLEYAAAGMVTSAKEVQVLVVKSISANNGIIIPTGWIAHATIMVIRPARDGFYNLAYINSGHGLQHHYSGPDPDSVYPHLSRLWIEFENIPMEEIFNSETAWLICALVLIKNSNFAEKIKTSLNDGNESLPNYLYGSLLANFKGYMVVPQGPKISDRLVPEQQSGSCAMSSLMGALLYYSDSLKTFHWYRLKLGHVFLETFLDRLKLIIIQQSSMEIIEKSNAEFLNILNDGFFSGGSKHFYGLIRALANHQLQYLEHEFPEEFKHAGLIGSGRSTWIRDKKAAAIRILSTNEAAKIDLQRTIKLARSVQEMASKLQFRPETTHIKDLSEIHKEFSRKEIYMELTEKFEPESAEGLRFTVADGGNIYQTLLSDKPELFAIELIPISSFEDFHRRFTELFNREDFHKKVYFMRFLDIFKGLRAGGGWELIHNHTDKEELLYLQRSCKQVAFRFAKLSNSYETYNLRKATLDEITLLGHLQLLTWNLFKALHNLDFPNPLIDWKRLGPPQSIQGILLEYRDIFSGNLISGSEECDFPIKSFNSIDNYKLYQLFLEDSQTNFINLSQTSGMLAFPGPELLQRNQDSNIMMLSESEFRKHIENIDFREILNSFTEIPAVEEFLNELRRNNASWAKLSIDHAKFLIVMYKGQDLLFSQLQHFYNLMFTLQCIRLGARSKGIKFMNAGTENFWLNLSPNNIEYPDVSLQISFYSSKLPLFYSYPMYGITKSNSANDLFYFMRHSYAHPKGIGFTDVDTLVNYIKAAKSSKIFDSSYFQYMIDHLLNIPKHLEYSTESILLFDENRAREIVLELIKLIRNTLNELNEMKIMTVLRHETIVRRAINISVMATRFISRMDYEFKESIDSVDWASLLARLYNTLEPYSYFNSPILKLSDSGVSMLNFALSHMCYTHLSVPGKFIKSIKLGFMYPYRRNRRTLARFHWFVAKMNYCLSTGDSISDDQFKYGGFLGSPLEREEIGFLESLLKIKFLSHYLRIVDYDYAFKYEAEGYVVEIIASLQDSLQTRLLINLATGAIIENGLMLANKSSFINSFEFQKYFPPQNHNFLSSKGKAFVFSGVPVFLPPTFKGSNYFMIQYFNQKWLLRKWNNQWYIWRPEKFCDKYFEALKYNWTGHAIKTFKKYGSTRESVEMLIFDKEAVDPIAKITKNRLNNLASYRLSIPGLTDEFSGKIINSSDYLESHLNAFAEEGVTVARQESDGTLLVAYHSYRLHNDPTRPFVLISSPVNNVIRVQNLPGMEICKDQRIGKDGSGLPGSLVATIDGNNILLLPFAEVFGRSKNLSIRLQARVYTIIEKIPIVEVSSNESTNGDRFSVPAPQSRMHRLLLAYYMILAQHYDSARNLLHPSTSFHNNEAFSKEELEIILWIMRIDMKAPEFNALIIIIYSHFLINEAKFTFEYDQNLSNLVQKVKGAYSSKIFEKHLMSIRELPGKYYIFKIFPEILTLGSTLSRAFLEFGRIKVSEMLEKPSEEIEFPSDSFYVNLRHIKYEFGERQSFKSLLLLMNADLPFQPEINLMKYLLIRTNSRRKFDKSYEMAMYCYISKPELWIEFKNLVITQSSFGSKRDSLMTLFNSAILQCQSQRQSLTTQSSYQSQFEGISLAHMSETTDYRMIRETMIKDLGIARDYEAEIMDHTNLIDTGIESDAMLGFNEKLMDRIRELGGYNIDEEGFGFDSNFLRSSAVLTDLSNSIRSFISERGRNNLTILKFSAEESLLTKLQELNQILLSRVSGLRQLQTTLDESLTFMTSAPQDPQSLLAHSIKNLFSMMHQSKQKSFSDLYACYLRNSSSCIQKKFPQLDPEQCEGVKELAITFFSQQILLDYLEMVQKSAQSFLISNSVPIDDLLIFYDELEKISDFNARIQNPVIMNFEFRSRKYRLKREQVADIALLTAKEGGPDSNSNFRSVVIQRMMAAGKTLVLGTISVVMKALKGEGRLSILVPPSSLYQSNTSAMQNRTYQYFKKKGNNFSFPRLPLAANEALGQRVSAYLANVIQIINQTIESRNYLILSPDHLQSFMNSYIEAIENAEILCTGDNYDRYSKILKQFATIYQIFKTRSSIILDEIDMTMDPKKELNFPTKETETYNMTAVAMLADIIEFMLFDQDIKQAGLNIHSNNQAALTVENYITCRNIVFNYIESQFEDGTSVWRNFAQDNYTGHVMEFLKAENMSYTNEWFEFLSEERHKELASALIIVKTQLYLHLQEFLGGTVNQNYGSAGPLRPRIKYAVPYVAANTPSAGSVFADRWETLIKTILTISATPCPIETAKNVIKYVQKTIMAESAGKPGLDFTTLPTFQNMKMILPDGFKILELDENEPIHVENVHKGLISRSPSAIRIIYGYYINEVLSKMEFPVDQITSNALHMTSMFASVQGYSGTIDNVNILPYRVVSAAAIDHENNEKNNGGIALKLINDSCDATIPELGDDFLALSANEMMSRFLDIFKQESIDQVSAIIDAGAFFKNFKNRQVSEAILRYFKGRIEAVLYYDETSNQLEFVRGKFSSESDDISFTVGFLDTTDPEDIERTTQTRIEERFTFYDQRHITGSDILQPKGAHAVMSAGPRVLLRDILQGTMRMRQFMTSQKVHLVVTESVRKFYRSKIEKKEVEEQKDVEEEEKEEEKLEEQEHEHLEVKEKISVSDLLTLGALNEDEKQRHENEKLAFGKIDAEIRAFVLDEISKHLTDDTTDIEKITKLYRSNRDLFVRSIRETPAVWLVDRKPQNTAELLDEYVAHRLFYLSLLVSSSEEQSRYENFTEQLGLMYKIEYKAETDCLLKYLSKEIHVRVANSIGTEVVMQNQTLSLTLVDLDLDQLVEQIDGDFGSKRYVFDLLYHSCLMKDNSLFSAVDDFFNLKTIYEGQPESRADLVNSVLLTDGNDIGVTTDLIKIYEDPDCNRSDFPIFSKYNMEGTHYLVFTLLDNLDQPKVILLSPRHAAQVFRRLEKPELRNYNFWLCDLSGGIIISKTNLTSPPVKNIFKLDLKIKTLIFDLLIFNGSFPQILANSKLRKIYENEWMTKTHFQSRATFLRLRMRVLQEKDSHMFEDDDSDYVKLKRYSLGDFVTEKEISRPDGYSKGAINSEIQATFILTHLTATDETVLGIKSNSYTLERYINEIFGPTSGVEVCSESCLTLQVQGLHTLAGDELMEIDDYHENMSEFSDHESSQFSDCEDEIIELDYQENMTEFSDHKHDGQNKKMVTIANLSTNSVFLLSFFIALKLFLPDLAFIIIAIYIIISSFYLA